MSNLAVVPPTEPTGTPAAAKAKKPPLIPALAGAAILGLALGAFILAPVVGGRPAPGEEKTQANAGHGKGSGKAGGKHAEKPELLEIENVVVNPAGSEGLHFIMATVTLEVPDRNAEAWLRDNQHVVRDVILTTLSHETLDALCLPGARDEMKHKIAEDVGRLVDGAEMTVYLPEFVVQ